MESENSEISNESDGFKVNALHIAAYRGDQEMVQALLDKVRTPHETTLNPFFSQVSTFLYSYSGVWLPQFLSCSGKFSRQPLLEDCLFLD